MPGSRKSIAGVESSGRRPARSLPRRKEAIERVYERARAALGIPGEEAGHERAFLADAVRVQLTLRAVEARLGPGRLAGWLAQTRRLPVDYPAQ